MIPREFSRTLRYLATAEPATLLADIAEIGVRSQSARHMRRVWACFLITCFLAGVIVAFAGAPLVGIGVVVIALVLFGLLIHESSRQIVDERRRKLAQAVVRALSCDVAPGDSLELGIDFNRYNKDKYRQKTEPVYNYQSSLYRLAWLFVSGRLADGTRLEFWADHVVNRKERSKTKGRKKVKEDVHEHIRLNLRPRRLPADAETRWPQRVRLRPMPERSYLHHARVKNDSLVMDVRTQRQVRVTNKGVVESGKDLDSRLATRHTLLAPLLCAFDALRDCHRGL